MVRRNGWLALRTHTVKEAFELNEGEDVTILGWVTSKSVVGGIVFAVIRDGSGYIQVAGKLGVTDNDTLETLKRVTKESAVVVSGAIKPDKRAPGGKEVLVKRFEIISPAEKWPITKSAIKSPKFLYDKRHLSIRGKKSIAIMKIRAEVILASIDYFVNKGFTLISAPTLVQSACEGGATLFPLDYFNQRAYLTQSAQLYEEASICAFEKVFTIQPAFRAERSKTPRHLTEFWMVEAEQAFADFEDNLKLQEELVSYIVKRVIEKRSNEFQILGRSLKGLEEVKPPFPRITYDEVYDFAIKRGLKFNWGDDLPTEVEREVSKSYQIPFFIIEYPLSARSFYHMTKPDDERITLSSDLLAPEGYGEIATGGQRLHDYNVLLKRLEAQDLPIESFEWYLELRKYGLPPHSGFGLGVERMTSWLCGLKHIRAATLFPRTVTRINP
ncbi:MAG: asparagine--tRNA ligase [Nitrososphaerota archaeon]|nr:asparagine--tRNA ligase [Nitrososphaerales archaeon]MDW8044439.1 asparagine--tRNA ligase [Nitrososphaerota archaeon]